MPRKIQTPIEFRIRALSVPKSMKPGTYLRSLLSGIGSGELPRGVKVELYWRNPETHSGRSKDWQSDDFLNAIAESNGGFATALGNVIRRKLYGGVQAPPPAAKRRKPRKVKRGRVTKKPSARTKAKRRAPVPGRSARKVAHVPSKPKKLRKPSGKSTASSVRISPKKGHRVPKGSKKKKR